MALQMFEYNLIGVPSFWLQSIAWVGVLYISSIVGIFLVLNVLPFQRLYQRLF